MCTLMSFSKEFWKDNEESVVNTIISDNRFNAHGCSLVLLGDSPVVMQCMSIDALVAVLDSCEFSQAFVHQRFSTTAQQGVAGCHAFYSASYKSSSEEGWHIMHNGILLSDNAQKYRVDSMYLADLVDNFGIGCATAYALTEDYANVFWINCYTQEYIVTRTKSGTLFTDGLGNYSSHVCANISIPVSSGYKKEYVCPLEAEDYTETAWTNAVSVDLLVKYDDFLDYVYDNRLEDGGMTDKEYNKLSKKQRNWYDAICTMEAQDDTTFSGSKKYGH